MNNRIMLKKILSISTLKKDRGNPLNKTLMTITKATLKNLKQLKNDLYINIKIDSI